jgi:uncharacterized protein (TIGR02594 family)
MSMTVLTIQRRLKGAGFDPGPLDGVRGRLTVRAIKAFQAARGLAVDGVVGPVTEAALSQVEASQEPAASGLVWLDEALRLRGTMEAKGGDNPDIMDWADDLDIHFEGDHVPWCGLFAAHCVAASLPEEPLTDAPLWARGWLEFGRAARPAPGAIMVFWRKSRTGALGHVGFYVGEDERSYHVLGGNQSDQVNVVKIAKDRFLAARWPLTAGIAPGGAVEGALEGAMSLNEA